MDTIVLDYSDGSVTILKHREDIDIEEMIMTEGFRLQDCEWMSMKSIEIKSVDI